VSAQIGSVDERMTRGCVQYLDLRDGGPDALLHVSEVLGSNEEEEADQRGQVEDVDHVHPTRYPKRALVCEWRVRETSHT
jgi:hypothetical protein